MAGEDVQNQLRSVQYAARQCGFQVAQLCRRQVVIKEHQVGLNRRGDAGNLLHLAGANQPSRIRPRAPLEQLAATTPPALATSSRNSARDSSVSNSVDERDAATLAAETPAPAGLSIASSLRANQRCPALRAQPLAARPPGLRGSRGSGPQGLLPLKPPAPGLHPGRDFLLPEWKAARLSCSPERPPRIASRLLSLLPNRRNRGHWRGCYRASFGNAVAGR